MYSKISGNLTFNQYNDEYRKIIAAQMRENLRGEKRFLQSSITSCW